MKSDKIQMSWVMDKTVHAQITESAKESGISINALVNIIVKDYLNKSRPVDTMQLLMQLNTSNADKTLLITTLDKVITAPTKKNYDTFMELLSNAKSNNDITQEIYNGLYSMAKIIPIKK